MNRFFTAALFALLSFAALGATTTPVSLLNPAGSTSGQAIVSTGPSSAPAWGSVTATALAAQAANTVVANATGSSASPTAFAMPSCSTSASALNWTTNTGFTCNTAVNAAQLGGATFAAPGPIGSTTPSTGKFTTLTTTAMSRVIASTTNALSVPTGAFTAITTYTASLNQGSNFNASTGVYTTPAAGLYDVRAAFRFSLAAGVVGTQVLIAVYVNGAEVAQSGSVEQTTSSIASEASGAWLVNCAAGDTITVRAFQSSGGSRTLDGTAPANWLVIEQLP